MTIHRDRARDARTPVERALARRPVEPDDDELDDYDDDELDERPAPSLPSAVSDATIETTVRRLNRLARASGLHLTLSVGRLLIDTFYGGDRSLWRLRGADDASFRRLAQHPALEMSASSLQRCCAAVEMVDRLGIDVATWQHLTPSHLRIVVALPAAEQRPLLVAAEEGQWPVERLGHEAARHRRKDGRGRKPLPPIVKTANRLQRLLSEGAAALSEVDAVLELDDADFETVVKAVRGFRERLNALETALGRRSTPILTEG